MPSAFDELIDPAAELSCSAPATCSPRGRSGTRPSRRSTSATSPATRAGAGRESARHGGRGDADVQGQRHGARQRRQPPRLRAGLELRRPLPRRRRARASSPSTTGARYLNSPNDVVVARPRRQHLLHRSRLRPLERLDRPGAEPQGSARLPRALPRAARRRRARARRRPRTSSSSRTDSASRPTSRCSTSTTRRARNVKVFDVAADGSLGNGRLLTRASAPA